MIWSSRASAGALLGERGPLGADLRRAALSLDSALGDLGVDRTKGLALGDQPFVQPLHLRAAGEQGGAAVLDLALGARALGRQPLGAAGRALGEARLAGRERALPLERGDSCGEAGFLLRERARLGRAELERELLLAAELIVLGGELAELAGRLRPGPAPKRG